MIRRSELQQESKAAQKEALRQALIDHAGNVRQTALALSFARSHVNRLLDEYELRAFAAELRSEAGARALYIDGRPVVGLGRPAGSRSGRK